MSYKRYFPLSTDLSGVSVLDSLSVWLFYSTSLSSTGEHLCSKGLSQNLYLISSCLSLLRPGILCSCLPVRVLQSQLPRACESQCGHLPHSRVQWLYFSSLDLAMAGSLPSGMLANTTGQGLFSHGELVWSCSFNSEVRALCFHIFLVPWVKNGNPHDFYYPTTLPCLLTEIMLFFWVYAKK